MKHSTKAYLDALEQKFYEQQVGKFPEKLELCIGFDGRLVTQETYCVGAVMPRTPPMKTKERLTYAGSPRW